MNPGDGKARAGSWKRKLKEPRTADAFIVSGWHSSRSSRAHALCGAPLVVDTEDAAVHSLRDFSGGTYISLQNKSGPWPNRSIMRRMRAAVSDLSCYITASVTKCGVLRTWGHGARERTAILANFLFPYGNYCHSFKTSNALYTVLTFLILCLFQNHSYLCACTHMHTPHHTHTALTSVHPQFLSTIYIHELFSDLDLNFSSFVKRCFHCS